MTSPYDSFAWFYDRYWAAGIQEWQKPALEKLLFSSLPDGGTVLDLCCGAGHLAQVLSHRGYFVTGVDASEEMLRYARAKVPQAKFVLADATDFVLQPQVDAAVCVFDSLNHLLQHDQLHHAFQNVYSSLKPGGCFVFDVNASGAYGDRWNEQACEVHPDHAFFLRGGFDPQTRIAQTKVTMFRLLECWRRYDVEVRQRPWDVTETETMLRSSGFSDIDSYRASEDLGMTGHFGIGRVYFRAYRTTHSN